MDEIKSKILTLLNKQNVKIPSMGFSDTNYHQNSKDKDVTLSVNSKTAPETDRPADQEILESIEAAYFAQNENFDICRFELEKLPATLYCDKIQDDFRLLKRQHQVVSKKVLQLILEHQNACGEEFQEVLTLCAQLTTTVAICQSSRSKLKHAEQQLAATLGVLANYKKRKSGHLVLLHLGMIKSLSQTDEKLKQLLDEEQYSKAIELVLEAQALANANRQFTCVTALCNKLQETLEYSEEQLDRVLAQNCISFDEHKYGKLQEAYRMLGKTQIAIDHLHMHYVSAIYNGAVNIVHGYVQSDAFSEETSMKKPYKNLCLSVDAQNFIPCLTDLCKAMFKILLSYRHLVRWHETNDLDKDETQDMEENFNRQYVRQKLEQNVAKIWQDVQSKVSSLLMNSDLANYKFDQFVKVLSIVHRLIEVGDEFCSSGCEELHESIRKQSVNYFRTYHAQRLEELKIFLENETWTVCPVKSSFHLLQLQEFNSLKHHLRHFKRAVAASVVGATSVLPTSNSSYNTSVSSALGGGGNEESTTHSQDGGSSGAFSGNYFMRYAQRGTPFDYSTSFEADEDILMDRFSSAENYHRQERRDQDQDDEDEEGQDESEEESEELKQEFVNDEDGVEDDNSDVKNTGAGDCTAAAFILTNTTLTVLRQMGKYLQMSRLLRPIAFDIIKRMNQLFDFYLYSVHALFTEDLTVSSGTLYTPALNSALVRIRETLIREQGACSGADQQQQQQQTGLITKPTLSPLVNLHDAESLYGLCERVVAVESCVFLARQFESLQPYLEHLSGPANRIVLQQFFAQTISSAESLRRPVYMCVAARTFDLRQILASMSRINWEVKEVMSQHNDYVDLILREVQIFMMRLQHVDKRIHLGTDVTAAFWENCAHIITHTLVQGFSEAKKCSPCGRALMRLDFTHLAQTFEMSTKVRAMPHKEYVDVYIKAFYIPESELDEWMPKHKEYSAKHLIGLINCVCPNNKKSKQRLMQVVEDMEKNLR